MDLHVGKSSRLINKNKDLALEAVRCVALFFVLFTHTGNYGSKIYQNMNNTYGILYFFSMALDVIRISSVPLFLMISGAVLLGKNEPILTILKKRIMRFLFVLIIFSLLQYIYSFFMYKTDLNFIDFVKKIYTGGIRGEYWYLYLYLAYLLLLPIIRPIAQKMTKGLVIYLVLISTFADLIGMIGYFGDIYCSIYSYISLVSCYSILFPILGYGCYNILRERRLYIYEKMILLSSWMLMVAINTYITYLDYLNNGSYSESQIWRFNAIITVPVFCIIVDICKKIKANRIVKTCVYYVGNASFGIYLLENFIERYSGRFLGWIYQYVSFQLLNCFLYLLLTIIVGTVVINIIKKIPLISKII